MKKIMIGVMGPGETAQPADLQQAYELGQLIAQAGWILLSGGRNVGVMHAANQGAKQANGITVGILPKHDLVGVSEAVDIPIITDMGNARNNINVLSSDVVIACGMSAGTASEVALALKANKKVILLNNSEESQAFFKTLAKDNIFVAYHSQEAVQIATDLLT